MASRFSLYFEFVAIPMTSFALACCQGISLENVILFGLGAFLWTFVEFVLHHLSHRVKALRVDHMFHHRHPTADSGPSSLVTVAIVGTLLILMHWSILSGLLFGYGCFLYLHYAIHNWDIKPGNPLHYLRLRHEWHHAGVNGHFGVTTNFWDKVLNLLKP